MTFTRLNIALAVVVLLSSVAVGYGLFSWMVLLLYIPVYVIWLIYGAITIHSNFFMPVICRVDKPKKLALTFDDGPHAEYTPKMLDLLDKRGIKATFFVMGTNVTKNPELTKEISNRGHILANHTYNHPLYWGILPEKKLEDEITFAANVIEETIGKRPLFFRPPFGVINPKVKRVVEKLRTTVIGWDLRSRDGGPLKREQIYKMVKPRLEKSSIMLFHDTNPETYYALERILDDCEKLGLEIVPLDQLVQKPAYA